MKKNIIVILLSSILSINFMYSCSNKKPELINCKKISIENRWSDYNGGKEYLDITQKNDIDSICNRINILKPCENYIPLGGSNGYIEIYIDNFPKIYLTFTDYYGAIYIISGVYYQDDLLTKKIIELMEIKKTTW